MKPRCLFGLALLLCSMTFAADKKPAAEDSLTVKAVGTLHTGIVAIGGETTGTTITTKDITWELDFGKNAPFRKAAENLDGKKVVVEGSLEKRKGVEIKERWIVTVTGFRALKKEKAKPETALNAVEHSAQVQARVLDGSGRYAKVGDMESWIAQATAKYGSPLAKPYTRWIPLTSESQRFYTSKEGGFIINGKVSKQNENDKVEIHGCAGAPLQKTVTLKPGERRVIKLTDNRAPHNVFIALKAPVSDHAKERADALKADAKNFRLELNYNGEQDKPFYNMIISVPPINSYNSNFFSRVMFVKEHEATEIIDHLAREGFFDKAIDLRTNIKVPAPTMPGYTLKVTAGNVKWYEDLGWGLSMIHQLDALRNALPDNGKKAMDFLLVRLSGLRKQWEAEQPPLEAKVGGQNTEVQFSAKSDTTIIAITSKSGIDKAIIKRKSLKWPKSLLVRLYLDGLELFNVGNGEISVDWSVSSTGNNSSKVFLRNGGEETELDTKSLYHTSARIVGGNGKIPLKGGYFEVPLPAKLFEKNPEEITLKWIDFYRN